MSFLSRSKQKTRRKPVLEIQYKPCTYIFKPFGIKGQELLKLIRVKKKNIL